MTQATERQDLIPRGQIVFDSLRAEDEPWLDICFVPPLDFDLMNGTRSVLIFGDVGAGKTALHYALRQHSLGRPGQPRRLPVAWEPEVSTDDYPASTDDLAVAQINSLFAACALAVARYVADAPETFALAPRWARTALADFVGAYGQFKPEVAARLLEEAGPAGEQSITELLAVPAAGVTTRSAPERIAARLVEALRSLGLTGIWVLADSTGRELADQAPLVKAWQVFVSTLPGLKLPQFTYKLIVDTELQSKLLDTSGVERGYLDGYPVRWDTPRLLTLVERRLQLATGEPSMTLDKLADKASLVRWLERTGGQSPREWLRQVRHVLTHYLAAGAQAPVSTATLKELRRQYPPSLRIDTERQEIIVGARRVAAATLPERGYDTFVYLYQRSRQSNLVSQAELYYRGYLGLPSVPRVPTDESYVAPKSYEGLMHTLLYRLRQQIEPDPSEPVLFETVKGRGVRLLRPW